MIFHCLECCRPTIGIIRLVIIAIVNIAVVFLSTFEIIHVCLIFNLLPAPQKMLLEMIVALLQQLDFAKSWWDISPIAGKRKWQ